MIHHYDVIVVGAGHAGCEAASASARLGSKTLLITMDIAKIAQMSCNPAVGGIAKGQMVREIDALGGQIGIIADQTSIQFRMLNSSKGPAMWSPRSQNDRMSFINKWRESLNKVHNLFIWQDVVVQLIVKNGNILGVKTKFNIKFYSKAVILTLGTFLNGLLHIGKVQIQGGRVSESSSLGLTEQLVKLGLKKGRMKTGTPVRIDGRSVDFSCMQEQKSEVDFHRFSYLTSTFRSMKQLSCWILNTNEACHDILKSKLHESPLYNGQIQSIGPRYCPSIETKMVIFPDKKQHQLFLEPEGENVLGYYLNGFSSSLPFPIQLEALRKIPGFKNVQIYQPGYAIEYDFFDPTQLYHTLECKQIRNLFFAGQINGTTGYEEAAAQGIMAGINAHINVHGGISSFILKRKEAYIGVLIDDLVTKGVDEPYRMFTSRAEYRILLRQDNADMRLTEKSYQIGLADSIRYREFITKKKQIKQLLDFICHYSVKKHVINNFLESCGTTTLQKSIKLIDLLVRPQLRIYSVAPFIEDFQKQLDVIPICIRKEIVESVEIQIKYDGYIAREKLIAKKMDRLENLKIQDKFDYYAIQSISTEAKQKLTSINPKTIAQASRIPGISPSDINVLLLLMKR